MKQGTITGISGPVIDVRFPEGSLPSLPLPKKQRGEYPGIKSSCKRYKVKGVQ